MSNKGLVLCCGSCIKQKRSCLDKDCPTMTMNRETLHILLAIIGIFSNASIYPATKGPRKGKGKSPCDQPCSRPRIYWHTPPFGGRPQARLWPEREMVGIDWSWRINELEEFIALKNASTKASLITKDRQNRSETKNKSAQNDEQE